MRLDEGEQTAIRMVFQRYAARLTRLRLFLYGSRTDDHLRGGDIDLLVVVADEQAADLWRRAKVDLLVDLKESLGDRRIDIATVSQAETESDPFVQEATRQAVLLGAW